MRPMSNRSQYRSVLLIIAIAAIGVSAAPNRAIADGGEADGSESGSTKEAYPAQLSLRPLTLFEGMTQATLSGGYWWINDEPNQSPVSLTARFGITDWWDASARTFLRLSPDAEWRDVVSLSTKMLAYDSARVDFAPGIHVPINFDLADDAHLFPAVALDATTRVFITKRYSVIIGKGLVPLGIGRRASLNLNYSFVVQGKPNFGIRFSSQLFHIRLNGDVRKSGFQNVPPVLTFFYSFGNWMDISVTNAQYGGAFGLFGSISIRN
tara:strand:- start:2102 stop:2899 length:798 start_codon:yes stop_codon:yes gene_type:complete